MVGFEQYTIICHAFQDIAAVGVVMKSCRTIEFWIHWIGSVILIIVKYTKACYATIKIKIHLRQWNSTGI